MEVTLDSLVGEHMLSGVDMGTERIKKEWGDDFEDCQCVNFILDGVTYVAVEDPSDGYRSSMDRLTVTEHVVKNVFDPVKVLAIKKSDGDYAKNDTLQLFGMNGKVILEVGTDNSEDYYPSFVSSFRPENIPVQS